MKKIKTTLYVTNLLYGLAIALFTAIIYLYMEKIGYSLIDINLFISIFWIVSFIAEIPSGVFADSFGRRNTAILSCIIRGLGLICVFMSFMSFWLLILSGILTALGSALFSGTLSAWVYNEIQAIDENYDFNPLFARTNLIGTISSIAGGYLGAQVIGVYNLGYPMILSGIILFITALFLFYYVPNDNIQQKKLNLKQQFSHYKNTINEGIHYLKKTPTFLLLCLAFTSISLLSTPAFNQWQLYFKMENGTVISGYINIFISLFGMLGVWVSSKLKIKNYILYFILINVFVFVTLILSVVITNIYVALFFFFLHVMCLSMQSIFQFTYLNSWLNKDIRSSLMSVYYALDALVTIFVVQISGWIAEQTNLGLSWIIIATIGLMILIYLFIKLSRSEKNRTVTL